MHKRQQASIPLNNTGSVSRRRPHPHCPHKLAPRPVLISHLPARTSPVLLLSRRRPNRTARTKPWSLRVFIGLEPEDGQCVGLKRRSTPV